jgi:5-methylthioribose kinase
MTDPPLETIAERFTDLEGVATALVQRGRLPLGARLVPLAGGVSGFVGLADTGTPPFVVKTARRRLAVSDEWLADPSRSLREGAILRLLDGRLGPMRVPHLLFVEADLNLIGLEAFLPIRPTWREDLLQGVVEPGIARALGTAMAVLHRLPPTAALASPEGMVLFDALRVEPYYMHVSKVRPHLAPAMLELAADVLHPTRPGLVHGDVTPKNVLVADGNGVLLDFEVIHWGEPAFDLAMLFAHFSLKATYQRDPARAGEIAALIQVAWRAYQQSGGPAVEATVVRHLGGVVLARLLGKSRVVYLNDPGQRSAAEQVAFTLLTGSYRLEDVAGLIKASR